MQNHTSRDAETNTRPSRQRLPDASQTEQSSGNNSFRNIYSLFEAVPFAVALLRGPDLIIEFINQYNLDIWQSRKEDVIGRPLFEARPDIRATAQPIHDEIYRTGKRFEAREVAFVFQEDGQSVTRYFDAVVDPLRNEAGVIIGQLATSIDVTEKVLARQKTEESATVAIAAKNEAEKMKRLYEAVTGSTPDLVYVFDLNYRFTYANPALLAMWGTSWEEAIGKGLRALGYEEWHAQMHEREIDEIIATKKSVRGTVSFPHAELGKRIYDYLLSPVINENGEVEAIAGITRDVSDATAKEEALMESESRFRTMAEHSPVWVWMTDDKVNVSYANKEMLAYLGLSHHNEFSGYVWERLTHPDDIQSVYAAFDEAAQKQQAFAFESRVKNSATGAFEWCLFKGVPHVEKGKFIGFIGTALHIHQQKTMLETLEHLIAERTQELAQANKELHRSNEDLQQFAHVASHDLKEPVRKVMTFSNRLKDELRNNLPEKAATYLSKIEGSAIRMYSMIDGVLLYSSLNALEQTKERIELTKLIENIVADLEIPMNEKEAQVHHSNLPVVQGSSILLYQLFYNLINNSLKFVRPGVKPLIQVAATAVDAGELSEAKQAATKYWQIVVEDNGIGFKEPDAEKIFATFMRLHPKDRYEGTGLGLTLCRKIVERHGGTIKAEGKEGAGAKFTILLPEE